MFLMDIKTWKTGYYKRSPEALKDHPTCSTKSKTSTPIRENRVHPKNWKKENTTAI
jgi:hypothetical protein